eukprot:jgi/Mesvir1/13590/Mv19361-RA.1
MAANLSLTASATGRMPGQAHQEAYQAAVFTFAWRARLTLTLPGHLVTSRGQEHVLDEEALLLASGTHEALRGAFRALFDELRRLRSNEALLQQENQRLENELLQSSSTGHSKAGDPPANAQGNAGVPAAQPGDRPAQADEAMDMLVAHGIADGLPKYLRFSGKVKVLWLSEEKFQALVVDVWAEKRRSRCKDPLPDFLYKYIRGKVENHADIPAWGHGLLHAGREFKDNAEIRFFHDVLLGEVSEDVHKIMLAAVDGLRGHLKVAETEKDGHLARASGFLTKDEIKAGVQAFFPSKGEEQMRAVEQLLEEQARAVAASGAGDLLDYTALVNGMDNATAGPLETLLRRQYLHDRTAFLHAVESHLREKDAALMDAEGDRQVQVDELRAAIAKADPSMAPMRATELIMEGFGGTLSTADLKSNTRVSMKLLCHLPQPRHCWPLLRGMAP